MAVESKRSRGFTLVELLVVIGIIALLTGILLPALSGARRSANAIVCQSNLRTLGLGMQTYATEWKSILPWEGYAEGDRPERHLGRWDETSSWFNVCQVYARYPSYFDQLADDDAGIKPIPKDGSHALMVCPEAGPAVSGATDDLVTDGYFMLWGLDTNDQPLRRKTYWCYGFNTQLDGGIEDRNVNYRVTIALTRIRHPSETALLVEKLMRPKEFDPPFATGVGQQEVSYREFTTRHRDGGYILFCDNHVGYFKRREVLGAPGAPFNYNQPGKLLWSPQ